MGGVEVQVSQFGVWGKGKSGITWINVGVADRLGAEFSRWEIEYIGGIGMLVM